jgi:Cu-processing system ATP-binding protein
MSGAVEIHGLAKSYGRLQALTGASFSVAPGEVVALLGPNGSGKTTCLRCIAGLLKPDAGTITVNGYDLARNYRQARQSFCYLPQQASFAPTLRVREVLAFHAQLRGIAPGRIAAALSEAGLGAADAERLVGQLSGGMRQRVSLAVAGLAADGLLLLDEPTANLDPEAALRFRAQAKRWREQGRPMLLSTHVLSDVEELADRVVVLVDGQKVAEESIGELKARLSRSARLRVEVGVPTAEHCTAALAGGALDAVCNQHAVLVTAPVDRRLAILRRLEEMGQVYRFETEQTSIEDVYLDFVRGKSDA